MSGAGHVRGSESYSDLGARLQDWEMRPSSLDRVPRPACNDSHARTIARSYGHWRI
jgi:hypothetical protein